MGQQFQKTSPTPLLDKQGHLIEPGYATSQLWTYDRTQIHASWWRIKEWDYYYVIDATQKFGITFTMSDLGYLGLIAVCWLDFEKRTAYQTDTMTFFPKGYLGGKGFPANSSEGQISFSNKVLSLQYDYNLPNRTITAEIPKFKLGAESKKLTCNLTLHQDPDLESMVIATSWPKKRTAFYYNQKINCMPVSGEVTLGDKTYTFSPDTSMAGLDWGRGNWTYKNRWYWSSASGYVDGKPFGWNFGYGFSDRSVATENMLFYEGKAHKLDEIEFHFNPKNYLEPWEFTSNDGRCKLSFEPIVDRNDSTNFVILKSIAHQVFGYFSGVVILDNGTSIKLDKFLGFAEDVLNWW